MYLIAIRKLMKEEKTKNIYSFHLKTTTSFVPQIGMTWIENSKAINIKVNNLEYSGQDMFYISHEYPYSFDQSAIDEEIEKVKRAGDWEVWLNGKNILL